MLLLLSPSSFLRNFISQLGESLRENLIFLPNLLIKPGRTLSLSACYSTAVFSRTCFLPESTPFYSLSDVIWYRQPISESLVGDVRQVLCPSTSSIPKNLTSVSLIRSTWLSLVC